MSFINKPKVAHPSLPTNALGMTRRQYEGTMSTLCAGCGHDSVTAAIIEACWGLDMRPEQLVKLSGIGCSSKTTSYFVSGAHGFNSVHGRMPSIASGANAANRELTYIGISGDGDSLSIGLGHMCHAIRRNVRMVYVIEHNRVYGLTKGQFSASADVGSKSKRGDPNRMAPIDSVMLGLSIGATFIGRSFSGDKEQLVPILKAAVSHRGFALIDVISPCVTFNDHEGSTKSYKFTRQHELKATESDFVPPASEILAQIGQNGAVNVTMHDGSMVRFKGVPPNYDPTNRGKVMDFLEEHQGKGEVVTGLLYLDESVPDLHEMNNTTDIALTKVPYQKLCPGQAALDRLQEDFR